MNKAVNLQRLLTFIRLDNLVYNYLLNTFDLFTYELASSSAFLIWFIRRFYSIFYNLFLSSLYVVFLFKGNTCHLKISIKRI